MWAKPGHTRGDGHQRAHHLDEATRAGVGHTSTRRSPDTGAYLPRPPDTGWTADSSDTSSNLVARARSPPDTGRRLATIAEDDPPDTGRHAAAADDSQGAGAGGTRTRGQQLAARASARRTGTARRGAETFIQRAAELWRPEEGYVPERDVGVTSVNEREARLPRLVDDLRRQDGRGVHDEELAQAVRELWAAEDDVVARTLADGGRAPGPVIDLLRARAEGITEERLRMMDEGVEFSLEFTPPAHSGRNYGSVRVNLLRYLRELTRLLRKYKLLPVKRQPWLLQECGFVVTQEGRKVRLCVDATATGFNERLRVGMFTLPTVEQLLGLGHAGDSMRKDDVGDMFLGMRTQPGQFTFMGIRNELTGQLYVYPWVGFGMSESPYHAYRLTTDARVAAEPELEARGLKPTRGDVLLVTLGEADEAVTEVLARFEADGTAGLPEFSGAAGAARATHLRRLGRDAIHHLVADINRAISERSLDAHVMYVDDGGWTGHGPDIDAASAVIRRKLNAMGLDFREEKTEGPATRLVFTGTGADLDQLELFVEQRKVDGLRVELDALIAQQGGEVDLRPVRTVVGRLSSISVAYSAGHTYIRRMWDALAEVPVEFRRRGSRYRFTPDAAFWEDVRWWRRALDEPARRRITPRYGTGRLGFWRGHPAMADVVLATDASEFAWGYVLYRLGFMPLDVVAPEAVTLTDVEAGVLGAEGQGTLGLTLPPRQDTAGASGARDGLSHASQLDAQHRDEEMRRLRASRLEVDRGRRYRGQWRGDTVRLSINWKELRTVLTACRRHGPEWRGKRVLVRVDNQAALSYVNRGYGRAKHLTKMGRQLKTLAARHGFELFATYVNTKFNVIPDGLSRLTVTTTSSDWMFDPAEFAGLEREFGPFHADMMAAADGSNAQLPRFYSEDDDAFAVDITGVTTWWNPPWDHVRRVLRHVIDARARAWRTRTRYPDATQHVHVHGRAAPAPATEGVIVLPRRSWEQAGASLQRHFTVVREYPAGTELFTTPDHRAADASLDAATETQYDADPASAPTRWSPRTTRFATVVVATAGLTRQRR